MHKVRYLRRPVWCLPAGCLLLALGWAIPAHASSTLEILGATSGGNQLTARVLSRGSAVTYFNPSLLPDALPKMEVGVFGLATQAKIRLKERPAGVDVPDSIYSTQIPNADPNNPLRALPTSKLPNPRSDTDADENVVYASIGMVRPLAGKSLVFGFYALLPVRAFLDQKGFYPDEREQYFSNQLHFELFGDRLAVSTITFAGGSQLADWLSIGAGIDVSIFTATKVTVYVPNGGDQSRILMAQDIHTDSRFNLYGAATVRPTQRVSLMATVHLPSASDTKGENELHYWDYQDASGRPIYVRQEYTFAQGSEPLRVGLGGSYQGRPREDGRAVWELGVQLLWQRWAQYRNRIIVPPGTLGGYGEHPLDSWSNTVSYVVGGGFWWRDRHVTMDLGYVPSPVPDQTGRTNYVDNSRLVASLGMEGPVRFLGKDLEAGISLFGSLFLPREVSKDPKAVNPVLDDYPDNSVNLATGLPAADAAGLQTNNPGYPGWKSTGYMVGAGVTFRIAR
jgi:long-chain fatty acid transport protein